jgi:error-prone DNA polymerase
MVNVICPPQVWERHRRIAVVAPALLVEGRIERAGGAGNAGGAGGAVNLVATALRPLRHLPLTGTAIASRDFR